MNVPQTKQRRRLEDIATNQHAELAIVGHMMRKPSDIDLICSIIRPDDFFDAGFQKIFSMLASMFSCGELGGQSDDALIASRFQASGILKEIGSDTFCKLLEVPLTNVRLQALEIQKRSNIRKLLRSLEMTQEAILSGIEYGDALSDLRAVQDAIESRQADDTKSVYQLMLEEMDRLKDWRPPDVMSGLPKIDELFGGFLGGELITVAACTGGGKSAFSLQLAQHNGMKGRPVLYVTMEMKESEKIKRLWLRGAGLEGVRFGRKKLTEEQTAATKVETERNAGNRQHIVYMPSPHLRDMETKIRAFRANHGLSLVVVDYISLIQKSDYRQTTQEKITEVTGTLKRLAGQLDCVVIALAQVNREALRTRRIELFNLADCASIERDSDIVLAINQPNEVDNGEREVAVLKNRSGEQYLLKGFEFIGSRMLFQERMFYEWGG
jgi:replicative DNA helicase